VGVGHKPNAKTVIGIEVSNGRLDLLARDVAVVDASKLKPSAKLIEMTEVESGECPYSRLRRS
jgi:hypothetical protein